MLHFRRFQVAIFAAIILSQAGDSSLAQGVDSTGYMEIFQKYIDCTKALQWDSAAALMHPEGLDHIKEVMVSVFDGLAEAGKPTDEFLSIFGNIENGEQLREMPSEQFFIAMMNSIMQLPEIGEMIAGAETAIIGAVMENDTLVHAVYRSNVAYLGVSITDVEVATAKRFESTWRMTLSAELEQFAEMFKQF